MQTPPFQLARTSMTSANPLADAARTHHPDGCCQPSAADLRQAKTRRAKLSELDSHLHCSIIGTCLSTGELRRMIPKFTDLDRHHASDLEEQTRALRNKLSEAQALLKVVQAECAALECRRSIPPISPTSAAAPRVRMGERQAHRVRRRPAEFERERCSSRWWTRRAAR